MNNFFTSRQWKVFVVTFAISAPIFFFSLFKELFMILIISFVLTMVLRPVVDYIENKGIPRTAAVLSLFLTFGSLTVSGLTLLYPIVVSQVVSLSSSFNADSLSVMLNQLSTSVSQQIPFLKSDVILIKLNAMILDAANLAGQTLATAAGFAASMMVVPFITFFLLNDYYKMQKAFIQNMPNKYFEMSLNLIYKLEGQLGKYIIGTCLESFFVAILYIIAYYILGVNYATVLGIIGGVANIIPFAGPFIGAIPVLIISIVQFGDLHMLIPIIIISVVVQQLDQIFVQPTVFSKIMSIHPLTMFLVILIGNEILGVMGMILAVPIYTVISVTAKETNWGLKNYRITQ